MSQKKVPYSRKPLDMTVEQWQAELRKQYAKEQSFKFTNKGDHPVYSDFEVFNPKSGNTYKVSIRDGVESYNFCSCPDFKVNTLGTCKHIEYLLHYFSKYKKYQKHLANPVSTDSTSLSVFYGQERKIRLKKSSDVDQLPGESTYFDAFGFLKPGMLEKLDHFIKDTEKIDASFKIYPDVKEFIQCHQKNIFRRQKADEIFPEGTSSPIFENLINTKLYNYQKEGVINIIKKGRILLADEMGLGKTIQAIAATEIFANHFGVKQVLIICPTSLKFQWKKEIEKFSSRTATVVEGLIHKRKDLYKSNAFYKIISYGVCRNDQEYIKDIDPGLVIIDEAQRIKNWKTQTAKAVKQIQSDHAIVLTGTPLENRIDELHSIVEYIDQYKLGPLFKFLHNHQMLDESGKLTGYKNLRQINQTLSDILLRRTKKEIQDQLPGRVDKNFYVALTKQQETDHKSYYDLVSQLVNKWIRQGMLSDKDRERLLLGLNCMRMVCDSTYLLNEKTNHGNKVDEIKDLLEELLENQDNKIVIFSQWKRMFELVIKELEKMNVPFVYLNGSVPAKQRKKIIDAFQENKKIRIFLSTDAGGVGVNLQSANVLINVDLPWNPAVLEQRIGRIYRLGQKKHVNIFNFISYRSIEHRIWYLLGFKKSVFTGVIEEEGDDTVTMESFLSSVKAMTEVNFEEQDEIEGELSIKKRTVTDNLAEENNKKVLESIGLEESPQEKPAKPGKKKEKTSKNAPGKRNTGFFSKIRNGFRKLFKRKK